MSARSGGRVNRSGYQLQGGHAVKGAVEELSSVLLSMRTQPDEHHDRQRGTRFKSQQEQSVNRNESQFGGGRDKGGASELSSGTPRANRTTTISFVVSTRNDVWGGQLVSQAAKSLRVMLDVADEVVIVTQVGFKPT